MMSVLPAAMDEPEKEYFLKAYAIPFNVCREKMKKNIESLDPKLIEHILENKI